MQKIVLELEDRLKDFNEDVNIFSGCAHGCSQPHIADIGFDWLFNEIWRRKGWRLWNF